MSELVVRAGQQPKAYSKAARNALEAWELNASQNHHDDLAPSLHLTKRKDVKIKPASPSSRCSGTDT